MKITVKGLDKENKELKDQFFAFVAKREQEALTRLAIIAEKAIKDNINSQLKHPESSSGNLVSKFYTIWLSQHAWGLGEINELNSTANYWRHLNYGSEAIGANWEHVLPQGMWVDGLWVESKEGYFGKPKSPIEGINYIEKTVVQLDSAIKLESR